MFPMPGSKLTDAELTKPGARPRLTGTTIPINSANGWRFPTFISLLRLADSRCLRAYLVLISTMLIERIGAMNWTNNTSLDSLPLSHGSDRLHPTGLREQSPDQGDPVRPRRCVPGARVRRWKARWHGPSHTRHRVRAGPADGDRRRGDRRPAASADRASDRLDRVLTDSLPGR